MPEKKKRTSGARAIQEAKARRTPASMARAASEIKLQAARRATAKRLSGQKATTQAELRARQTAPKPLTHGEKAAKRREKASRGLGFGSLLDVLKPKKKKKD